MTEADKALKSVLDKLHSTEIELELANALVSEDPRLNDAEIILHKAITEIERISRGREPEPQCLGVLVHSEYEFCPRCDR